jgi:hypothetical protein
MTLLIRATNARGLPMGESNRLCLHSDEKVRQARALHADGATYQQIADALSVPRTTVWRWCVGKTRRPPAAVRVARVKSPSADQQSAVPPAESTACAGVRKSSRSGVPKMVLSEAEIEALRKQFGDIA